MLAPERLKEIHDLADKVNSTSEKYQLIHAMFAIEKVIWDNSNEQYKTEVHQIWEQLNNPDLDSEYRQSLVQKAKALKKVAHRKINILVDYLPQIKDNSARITWIQNNTYMIVLPKSMESIRDADGKIDFKVLSALRKLMAHELGHVVLHAGIFDSPIGDSKTYKQIEITDLTEQEAEIFAEKLISLRRARNEEIHQDDQYKNI